MSPSPSASAAAPAFDVVLVGTGLGVHTLARAFHEEYGVVSDVVTKVAIEPMRRSVSCRVHELGASSDDEATIARLLELAADRPEGRPCLLLANADSVIQMLSDARERLEPHYLMPMPKGEVLERITDKAEFALLCAEHGVAAPRTEIVDFAQAAESTWEPPATEIPFPVVVKASRTSDMARVRFAEKKKVWFLHTPAELEELLGTIARAGYRGRVVVQELVPGDDTTEGSITAYVDASGRVTLLCSAQVLLGEHTPDALGRPAAMITTALPDALAQARTLLEATDYHGFANLDIKRDPRSGQWMFFEVNPRIGRNNFYVSAAGAPIARFPVADAVEKRELEPVTEVREILYSLVPLPLLMRYIRDPRLKRHVRAVARRGIANPWSYPADGLWAKAYAQAVKLNHVRKFLRHYPRPTDSGF